MQKIGINATAISRIEHNAKHLSPSKLPLISEIFEIELVKIKELYYGDKFAREAYENGCPESVFNVAENNIKYLQTKNTKQGKMSF